MEKIIHQTFDRVLSLRKSKGREYSNDGNALSNFCTVASGMALEPETVLMVLAGKHWDSIVGYARDVQSGSHRERTETIDQRIDDLITYMCLLKSMVECRDGKEKQE